MRNRDKIKAYLQWAPFFLLLALFLAWLIFRVFFSSELSAIEDALYAEFPVLAPSCLVLVGVYIVTTEIDHLRNDKGEFSNYGFVLGWLGILGFGFVALKNLANVI